jgi:hypothetical protein
MTSDNEGKEVVDVMHPGDSRVLHEQRLREQPRRWPLGERSAAATARPRPGRSVRRAVGRAVVRIGEAIEAEPRQPVAS